MTETIIIAAVLAVLGAALLARTLKPTFRCDRCGQRKPTRQRSKHGGWSDWCQNCAEPAHNF